MKSINEHLAALGKSLDSDSVKQSAQRARADVAKATAKTPDTETAQLVKSWAYSQLSQTTPNEHFARLGIASFNSGQKCRYNLDGCELFGVISKGVDKDMTASIEQVTLPSDDYGKVIATGKTVHIPYANVVEVLEDFPLASQRLTAFTQWFNTMRGEV